ncbi:Zn-dependent protease with chaperone function [Halovivax ruber XH-70]|uniref:Zn-dependent protease with chaperone function n=1 Tax=Halovivax ruber (strain DSM 18193 / JCM 13892 / XH-70) TaxID=797302 RepID=L0IFC4_HALRX|nr:M48 family metalloprotease [Halovivax ruber]AGB16672.1 Zn-dependent protease with chaperone function [Halovivax ruber XH-70]
MSLTRRHLSLVGRGLGALVIVTCVSLTIAVIAAGVLGATALLVVGTGLTLLSVLFFPVLEGTWIVNFWDLPPTTVVAAAIGIGFVALPVVYLRPVRAEIRAFERTIAEPGASADDRHPELAAASRKLAAQAGIPEPDLRIVNRRRPESYAIGGRTGGTIVLTRGLIRELDDAERVAVLAHEIAHLANDDSRFMRRLLVPLLVAERIEVDERPTLNRVHGVSPISHGGRLLAWGVLTAVTTGQERLCELGIGLFSRGREFAADRAAAELTGSPGALASALETLDDSRGPPTQDKREYARSTSTLDILPPAKRSRNRFFRTHPETARRIERLKTMAETAQETRTAS